jgi:hypothetical protein
MFLGFDPEFENHERAERESEQCRAQNRRELRLADIPFGYQRRGDEPDCGRIETVQQDDNEAHCKNEPLKPGEWVLIDERLNIDSRASTHFFPLPGSGF